MNNYVILQEHRIKDQKGLVVLIAVLIISAVILAIGVSLTLAGIDEISMVDYQDHSQETLAIADGCLEEALLSLNRDNDYSGASLNLGNGSCIIEVSGEGESRTILVMATLNNYTRRLEAEVSLSPEFMLISREELTD